MRFVPNIMVFIAALALSACSPGTTRFDHPLFGYKSINPYTTGSIKPVPSKPVYPNQPDYRRYYDQSSAPYRPQRNPRYRLEPYSSHRIARAPIQPVSRSGPQRTAAINRGNYANRPASAPSLTSPKGVLRKEPRTRLTAQAGLPNETITVRNGDTLYSLARRHDVPLFALKAANNLTGNNIKPGQKLVLPDNDAIYRVQKGDTISSISRKFGIDHTAIAKANNISNPNSIKPGQRLKIPTNGPRTKVLAHSMSSKTGAADTTYALAAKDPTLRKVRTRTITAGKQAKVSGAKRHGQIPAKVTLPKSKQHKRKKVAALENVKRPVLRSNARLFRWPVQGRIISKFGPKTNGAHNDGINVAVPIGTSVKAVENGIVAYAGNELKGYGNLILVRHDGKWVSAYAHNSKLLVKRGDKVTRGKIIAKAGKSGAVNQPQLHFELRKNSKPVDPTKYLARL